MAGPIQIVAVSSVSTSSVSAEKVVVVNDSPFENPIPYKAMPIAVAEPITYLSGKERRRERRKKKRK